MATYDYEALTPSGRLVKGAIQAETNEEARGQLEMMQLAVNSLTKAPPPRPRGGIGRSEFLLFNQQLASIAKAGVPLERSLREAAAEAGSGTIRTLIETIAGELEAGADIREVFERREKQFPPLYGRILEAGIRSGRLAEMLTSLNRHLEIAAQTRRIIIEAISYPLLVLSLAAAVLTAVFAYVVPSFAEIFLDMGSRIPGATRAILAVSRNIVPIWIGIGAVVLLLFLLGFLLSGFPAGRRIKETVAGSLPVLGRLYRDTIRSRAADAMALLIGSGCDMPTALRLGADATGSELMRADCELLAGHVERGGAMRDLAGALRVLPGLFLYAMEIGAQRNELADALYELSDMYERQARVNQGRLESLLLPVMVVILGCLVGFIIMAMFLPMIGLIDAISG